MGHNMTRTQHGQSQYGQSQHGQSDQRPMKASDVLGMSIDSSDDEKLGEIIAVVVSTGGGR